MRSIVKQHDSAAVPVGYGLERGAILIRGTVPYVSREQVTRRLDQLSRGGRCFLITLHPPAGVRLALDDWRRVITTALVRLGAPLHGAGWLAGMHVDTGTQHVHVAVAGRTFLGVPLDLLKTDAFSTAAHIDLARSMGLESPVYYDPDVPRLVPHSPVRRRNADEKLKKAHDDLVGAFLAVQPTSLEQLNAGLRVRGTGLELREDGDLSRDGVSFAVGEDIGPGWSIAQLSARLRHSAALSAARSDLEVAALLAALEPFSPQLMDGAGDRGPGGTGPARGGSGQDRAHGGEDPRAVERAGRLTLGALLGRITSVLRKGFRGWSLRPVRGKSVTVRFQDRSVAVVTRNVVGYARSDTVASRFAQAYHARWPSVRLEAFGAAARRMPVPDAGSPPSADQLASMEKIDDLSLGTAASPTRASAEVNPLYGDNEVEDVTGVAGVEPRRGSAGVRISPPPEDTIKDAEAEACHPVHEDRVTEDDMTDLANVDPPECPEDDLEKEEDDEFKPR